MTNTIKELIQIAIQEVSNNGGVVRVQDEKGSGDIIAVSLNNNKLFLTHEE
jgi:hypothetical protein